MRFTIAFFCALFLITTAQAKIIVKPVAYNDDDVQLRGTIAYDDAISSLHPGVLLVPEWWGHNEYIKRRAFEMAQQGYVAFAADMYGTDKVTTDPKIAGEWAGEFLQDRAKMRQRGLAALNVLRKQINVDQNKIAAIGFCFGGTTVLELARNGEAIQGVAAFHPSLQFPDEIAQGGVKAKILVMNGAADPMVSAEDRINFMRDMQNAKADVQSIDYSGALHAFTNPDADKFNAAGMSAVKYDAKSERRSMAALKQFFAEIFTAAKPAL